MSDQYIGLTACDECGTRFKVSKKYQNRLGKPVRCPKCKTIFTATLIEPTPLEQASIEESGEDVGQDSEAEARRKRRRSKSEIRQEIIDAIRDEFRKLHPRLVEIAGAARSSEEEVRRWCIDALENALGYDKGKEIDTEVPVLGQRADIVLKRDGQIFLVIECKNTRSKLSAKVRDQAAGYATSLSAEWAVITNGQIWKLYRIIPVPGRDPRFIEIFDVALLDEDGVSESDAESLYLLTSRAVFGGDLEKMSHRVACMSKKRLLNALESDRVIKALKTELVASYKDEHGNNVKLDEESVNDALQEALGLSDL